jgi:prepilin-type processing-associated H-X9-DG protein
MLVVITIIGMLMAMLFPGLNAAIGSARKAQCANNIRELAKGVQQYEADKGSYPGSAENVNGFVTNWVILVFPYIGRGDLWGNYRNPSSQNYNVGGGYSSQPPTYAQAYNKLAQNNSKLGNPPPKISQLICPADAPPEICPLSYVANCGMRDGIANSQYFMGSGNSSPVVPPDWPCNGIFHNHYWYPTNLAGAGQGVNPVCQVKMSSSDVKDGLQTTLMLSENVQAGEWCEPYPTSLASTPAAAIISTDTTMSSNVEVYTGMLHGIVTTSSPFPPAPDNFTYWYQSVYPINVGRDTDPTTSTGTNVTRVLSRPTYTSANMYQYARPSSMHGGGVNMAFCDGHVQFVKQTIAPQVYFQLMTPDEHNYLAAGHSTSVAAITSVESSLRVLAPISTDSF